MSQRVRRQRILCQCVFFKTSRSVPLLLLEQVLLFLRHGTSMLPSHLRSGISISILLLAQLVNIFFFYLFIKFTIIQPNENGRILLSYSQQANLRVRVPCHLQMSQWIWMVFICIFFNLSIFYSAYWTTAGL
jgi:hypothetical protein